jgi:flavin reductase (DIM6/NTAB) family NADH-FMN oxidoreductase RutF
MKTQKEWTVNFIRPEWAAFAHQTAKHIPRGESEFDDEILIEESKPNIRSPFVKNAPIQMHMEWLREIPIPENGTRLVMGRLRQLWLSEDVQIDESLHFDAFPVLSSWGLSHYSHGNKITKG